MKAQAKWFSGLSVAAVAVILSAVSPTSLAADEDDDDEVEIPFDEANVFIELNDTDGDLGLQALIDGEAWSRLEIESPSGRRIFNVRARGATTTAGRQ